MKLAGLDRPKVCKKKILCLYSPSVKVHSTKTSGLLRATKLFNSCVEEKLIRERTGHRSNALLTYEKPCLEQSAKVSNLLGPCKSSSVTEASGSGSTVSETSEIVNSVRRIFNSGTFFSIAL